MWRKIKQGKEMGWVIILNRVIRAGVMSRLLFLQRPEEREGVNHKDIWGKSFPGRRNSQCKGPEAGVGPEERGRGREGEERGKGREREKERERFSPGWSWGRQSKVVRFWKYFGGTSPQDLLKEWI